MKRVGRWLLGLVSLLATVATLLWGDPASSRSAQAKTPALPDGQTSRSDVGHPLFLSPHFQPIVCHAGRTYVVNTPSNTVDVIDATTLSLIDRITVGVEPVSLAVRPDGLELWVSNHISDSVSVIDLRADSPTRHQVVATIQQFDPETRATRFDEPVGIAFANDRKAYVALSAENAIAVIDVATRQVTSRLTIPAQDPRAIAVRNGKLYVLPFESNNQTQLSGGTGKLDGELATFDAVQHSIANNNVLSLGAVVDIVKHPRVPDRDLFVFDTETDTLVATHEHLGTLLYGLAVDSRGTVYVAQTDARNHVNGKAGTARHGLAELENRPFLNQLTRLDTEGARFIELDTLVEGRLRSDLSVATPFAITLTSDETTLLVAASGSDLLVTVDPASQAVVGRVSVGAVPEGIAYESAASPRAWVLNAADNSVSLVDLVDRTQPRLLRTIPLADPTPPVIKRGRIAFSTARASTTGTFSCASCHPDGHTDQLLWVLNTPIVSGGDQIMPRSTMPVRGLRDTAPFHWDGIPGDPYGGINSASVHKPVAANSQVDQPASSTRHLVDGGLASTMSLVGDPTRNDEGLPGRLSKAERDDMAEFLLAVTYPPAQRRAYTNVLSSAARDGFRLFHMDGDNDPSKSSPNVCGDCHRLPFLVSTNTPGTGMDAPTWRGAYDRWLILPQGRLNIIDFDFYRRVAEQGTPERNVWQFSWAGRKRFDPVWDMVLEGGTGYPGAFARQVTLSRDTAGETGTRDLFHALVHAAAQELVVLSGSGVRLRQQDRRPITLRHDRQRGFLTGVPSEPVWTSEELLALAARGELVVTLTAHLGDRADAAQAQPALWTLGPIEQQRGHQTFPALSPTNRHLVLNGRHLAPAPLVLVNGSRVDARLTMAGERVEIALAELPEPGLHFLQVQNPGGLTSNEFLFEVYPSEASARARGRRLTDILARTRWERLLGTWKDEASGGTELTQVIRWKIPDRVLEISSHERDNESVSLVSVDPKTGEVLHSGGNARGDVFQGTWDLSKEDDAVLSLQLSPASGQRGNLVIHHRWLEEGRLEIQLDLPRPIRLKMQRYEEGAGR